MDEWRKRYDEFEIDFAVAASFEVEYAGCGSHQVAIRAKMTRDDLETLRRKINNLLEEK